MTTENDFQAALDADPTDYQTRLVFADWLQDRDDPRAEGYRALGELRYHFPVKGSDVTWIGCWSMHGRHLPNALPDDWHNEIPHDGPWGDGTRRHTEDAAATAFAKLPANRRAELTPPRQWFPPCQVV